MKTKILTLVLGMTAMAGVSAQTPTLENAQSQQDFFTCMAEAATTCLSAESQEDMMACIAQAVQDCMMSDDEVQK